MDDDTNVDLVDESPITISDRFQITVKRLWGTGEPHSDAENGDNGNPANDSNYRPGSPSPQWLPYPPKGFRKLKPLTLDTNLPPPFLLSPGYPSIIESTPSPSSYILNYSDLDSKSLLPLAKADDNMRLHRYPRLLNPEDFDNAYAWDLRSRFSTFWDAGDDSDASESLDNSMDYITFTGRSASIPLELELGFRQFDLSEPRTFVLDFPEDVGESLELEHDNPLADGGSGVIGHPERPILVPASEIPVELSAQPCENFQTPPVRTSNLLPRIRKLSEDSDELESVLHLPYPELDVTGIPFNVPLSPFITDGFPDDTMPTYSDLVGSEGEGISADTDWLEGSWGEIICSPCLEEELMEWDRWRGQLAEELDRDLDSWAEIHESVWVELDRF
ncbi:hypothetical protein BDM02DRAFT_58716 [Thelephora ganbajun]|uniref:Uncharacterized protein n=1 Tax=Thelephora ganbajun TaxID=370292 RepID=A0ACB6ZWM1_THEGA|nr:hypothetical protein BDM02DRAFT_58716 [Thelephora ganbajun]